MCFGGSKQQPPPPAPAPAPPPPPPEDKPASPEFNEDSLEGTNADSRVEGARRGRKSLRIDLGVPTTGSAPASGSVTGLGIPQ
jgi:hypothetical protein